MSRFKDLSIFSKVKPETLKWVLDYIKECPSCYAITERNKYEFLKKCIRCKRYRGYKECVEEVAPSLYLNQEDDFEEMCLQEISEELANGFEEEEKEVAMEADLEKVPLDLSFEEVEYLKWCLEDLEDVEEIPMFSDEEVEYLQWCFEV